MNRLLRLAMAMWQFLERRGVRRAIIAILSSCLVIIAVPFICSAASALMYKSHSYSTAQRLWRLGGRLTWYDTDVPQNNAGLAYYRAGQLTPAIDRFEIALKRVRPARNCGVRWNLAVALSQRGDDRAANQQLNDAVGDYTRAVNVLDVDPCRDDSAFQQLRDALQKKIEALLRTIEEQHKRQTTEKTDSDADMSEEQREEDAQKRQREYRNNTDAERQREYAKAHPDAGYSEVAW